MPARKGPARVILSKRASAFAPKDLFSSTDVGYAWDTTDLTHVWQSTTGVTTGAVGSVVGRLDDISGKGNNINASGNNTTRPILRSVNNGMIQFDNVDDAMTSVGGFYAKGAMTWIGALKGTDTSALVLWSENASGGGNPFYAPGLRCNGSATAMLNYQKNDSSAAIANAMTVGLMDGNVHMYYVEDTGTQVRVSLDGSAFVTNSYTRSGTFTINQSVFGGAYFGTTANFHLGGGLVIGRLLTGALGTFGSERTNAYNYIAAKHGLTTL